MQPLCTRDVVKIWEIGQTQHPLDRALTLLTTACPEMTPDALAQLSVGMRDAALLLLREITFGKQLNCFADCPECGERLEATLNVADLRVMDLTQPQQQEYFYTFDDLSVQFRLPNSWDLAAIAAYRDLEAARVHLGKQCFIGASRKGTTVTYSELSSDILTRLATQIGACDPQAEILLDMTCPACGHEWQLLFDIVTFLWAEIGAEAKRLLRDVHTLARYYGWREADILAMSSMRRHIYLAMVDE
jgi:hypothetical protein